MCGKKEHARFICFIYVSSRVFFPDRNKKLSYINVSKKFVGIFFFSSDNDGSCMYSSVSILLFGD